MIGRIPFFLEEAPKLGIEVVQIDMCDTNELGTALQKPTQLLYFEPRKGIPEGYVRMSVGLEHANDIIADLNQALNRVCSIV